MAVQYHCHVIQTETRDNNTTLPLVEFQPIPPINFSLTVPLRYLRGSDSKARNVECEDKCFYLFLFLYIIAAVVQYENRWNVKRFVLKLHL